jgi:predicted O-linked N-acetylglucosamine transferase (SPINDLY family)
MAAEGDPETLKNNDPVTAVTHLERAARDMNFSSDLVNHAYTLALYRAGQMPQLADAAFRIGSSLVNTHPALAMDYFQRALFAGLDPDRTRAIGEVHERWSSPQSYRSRGPVSRVAHVVSCVTPGAGPTQYLRMLAAGLKSVGVESTIFTGECAAAWFFNAEGISVSQPVEIEAALEIADISGSFLQRSERLAARIRASGIPVVLFHGSLSEQILARTAAFRPGPVQINVNHGVEMDADLFDGFVHLQRSALERTRFPGRPAVWIPPVSDAEERLAACAPLTRQAVGLESAGVVSATFGGVHFASGSGYLRALAELMKRSPRHFHLLIGAGDIKAVRGFLHAQGVLPRVRFLGPMQDALPLLGIVDVYLSSFPVSEENHILEAMAAGKPVVVLKSCSGAELAGGPGVARNEQEYVDIADRLIQTPALRVHHGDELKDRFQREFRPQVLGRRYMDFIQRIVQ